MKFGFSSHKNLKRKGWFLAGSSVPSSGQFPRKCANDMIPCRGGSKLKETIPVVGFYLK